MIRKLSSAVVVFAASAIIFGCSDSDRTFDVSGTVTHAGKAVPKGLIFFDPDAGGPQGFASIENGQYDTAVAGKGQGIRGGKYTIRINGYDGKQADESPFGQALFAEHTFSKELPAQNQKLDYDVPKKGK